MSHRASLVACTLLAGALAPAAPVARADAPPSLMARALATPPVQDEGGKAHALRDASLFAVAPPELRTFHKHDLVQIIVRETSRAESTQSLDTQKDYKLDGKITAWPDLNLRDIVNFQLYGGRTTDLPAVNVAVKKDFQGDGDYKREDDLTARLTAEVVEVLPNGNLVLEARTHIKTDAEEATIKVTGTCRAEDVTAANTVLSSQVNDLEINKMHSGELRKASEKGILAKILDAFFAF